MALDVNAYADYGNLDFAKDDTFINTKQVFVELWADGQVHLPTSDASTKILGVLRDTTAKGEVPVVRRNGTAYVTAGADLTVGDFVTNDSKGQAIVAKTGQIVLGEVLDKGVKAGKEAKINLISQAAKVVQ